MAARRPVATAQSPDRALQRVLEIGEPWFGLVRSGEKTVEVRKANREWLPLVEAPGPVLIREPESGATVDRVVVGGGIYATVRDLLEATGLARVLPGVASVAAGEAVFAAPPMAWTPAEVERDGTLAIWLREP